MKEKEGGSGISIEYSAKLFLDSKTQQNMTSFRAIIILLLVLFSAGVSAQQTSQPVKLLHYVFDSFHTGTIKMKSGETLTKSLNYNIVTQEMIFDADGKYLAISYPGEVDSIVIAGRVFVPVDEKFFEKLTHTSSPLLMEFKCTVTEPGAPVGYGMASSTTASTSLRALIQSGGAYGLKLPDEFTIVPGSDYWIMNKGQLMKANNAQQVIRAFETHSKEVRALIKKFHTNFSQQEDIVWLINEVHRTL